jgi:hypothetical protein
MVARIITETEYKSYHTQKANANEGENWKMLTVALTIPTWKDGAG